MYTGFSISRTFDVVRLDGLRRATGRPPHEWDIYIIKELIDNALDADESLWHDNETLFPRVHIRVEYAQLGKSSQLFIQVNNRALFPIEKMAHIFEPGLHASGRVFPKRLKRGPFGSALKTILGIPYALRNRVAGDWSPDLKPLSIKCHANEFLLRYDIDAVNQIVRFDSQTINGKPVEGTQIGVGIDYFDQEVPRSLDDLQRLANEYRFCNPHVNFLWSLDVRGHQWSTEYLPNPTWNTKFQENAPVQWYSPTEFQELLASCYLEYAGVGKSELPVEEFLRFSGFDKSGFISDAGKFTQKIVQEFGQAKLTSADLEGSIALELYRILCGNSARFDLVNLGAIGAEHVGFCLDQTLPIDGIGSYKIVAGGEEDPSIPFIIEATVGRLKEGKRQIWTAINFTPTYADPFYRRWIVAPLQADSPVLGLGGFLDAYGFTDDTPIFVFIHLICPSVEFDEFSKVEINHLPFKKTLAKLLDDLLFSLSRKREEEERRFEQTVLALLDGIVNETKNKDRLTSEKLLRDLRTRIEQDQSLNPWLQKEDALTQLRVYVLNYLSRSVLPQESAIAEAPSLLVSTNVPLWRNDNQSCFVGFTDKAPWTDDLLAACEEIMSRPEFNLKLDYARKHFDPDVTLRQKAIELITNARCGIFDISSTKSVKGTWEPSRNVFIEFGMAITLNRPALLLRHLSNRDLMVPQCLEGIGDHILEFGGETTLRNGLPQRLTSRINIPPEGFLGSSHCVLGNRVCEYRKAHPHLKANNSKQIYLHISDGLDPDRDDFRGGIEEVLNRFSDLSSEYLDALSLRAGYQFLLCTYCQVVRSTAFAMYRINSFTLPETFITIGMSMALEKMFGYKIPRIFFAENLEDLPSLLAGYEVALARNNIERKTLLQLFLPAVTKKIRSI